MKYLFILLLCIGCVKDNTAPTHIVKLIAHSDAGNIHISYYGADEIWHSFFKKQKDFEVETVQLLNNDFANIMEAKAPDYVRFEIQADGGTAKDSVKAQLGDITLILNRNSLK